MSASETPRFFAAARSEGSEVKEGDLLFIIDPRRYDAELARANAEFSRAQAAVDLATGEAERAAKLVQTLPAVRAHDRDGDGDLGV